MLSFDELNPTGPGGLTAGTTLLSTAGTASSGVLLDHRTAGTLKVRLFDNSADGAISGSNLTLSGTFTYGGVTLPSTVTGTGSMVLATNPTISSLVATGTLTYGGVALSSTVTGTGAMVLATGPAVTALTTDTITASGSLIVQSAVAVSSAATVATQFFVTGSTTAGLGLFYGNGTPSFTAAAGSFYVNTTGSSTSTRAFVRSSASTWIAVTTAS